MTKQPSSVFVDVYRAKNSKDIHSKCVIKFKLQSHGKFKVESCMQKKGRFYFVKVHLYFTIVL